MLKKEIIVKKIEDQLDFDFNINIGYIDSLEDFQNIILSPYNQGKRVFYRGERKNSITRPLIPSIFRNKNFLLSENENATMFNCDYLYDFYNRVPEYFDLCQRIFGAITTDNMYQFLAFSQHYYGISPLIDFTKSPYVALSFALKDRTEYKEDILIYTLEILDDKDYTCDYDTANSWIRDYNVLVLRDITQRELEHPYETIENLKKYSKFVKGQSLIGRSAPKARLIDVPTNDLMRYQQGVFLLLDDFNLYSKSYFTKRIRDDFAIKKWLVSKDLCPLLLERLHRDRPYYAYKNITNLSQAVNDLKANNIL